MNRLNTPSPNNNNNDDPTRADDSLPADPEARVFALLEQYRTALEAGQKPSRHELLARHPDIAEELSACLQGLNFVQSAAGRIEAPDDYPDKSVFSSLTTGPDADPASPKPLGDFRLIREIGRGGMGVVYEALQLSLGRHVAVKVLPFATALDTRHLERFKNEAQAAAQLHHSNIVPVYAVGCERSVHFYAMQLIEGQSLAQVIRELRTLANDPTIITPPTTSTPCTASSPPETSNRTLLADRPALSSASPPAAKLTTLHSSKRSVYFKSVVRLGLQAADALDYAHGMGVVHRDIKPANLLLDARGTLWITDFGLAQFYASDAALTQSGDVLGTLRYMSPEQASGGAVILDQRTDVYSLGATLYELLTLQPAVQGDNLEQVIFHRDSRDPRSARAIDKTIPVELETILNKALAKDPVDRYQTARALADDLRRFMDNQPILARPPSIWDKAVKWTRRHKSIAVSAMVTLLLAVVALLTSTVLIAKAQHETKAAYALERDKTIELNRQRERSEASYKRAREAVDFFTRVAAQELADNPQMTDLRKELLEESLIYYQGFIDERGEDPSTSAELMAARAHVSSILMELSASYDFFGVMSRSMLLSQPSIREALHLSDDQVAKLGTYNMDMWGRGRGFDLPRTGSEDKRAKFTEMARRGEATLNEILTAPQAQRLKQIARQVRGPGAFSDPEVSEALALTRDQKDAIRNIQAQQRAMFHPGGPGPGGPPPSNQSPEGGPNPNQRPEDPTLPKIMALLTPTQMQTWQSLIGEPFTGPLWQHGPGGPHHGP